MKVEEIIYYCLDAIKAFSDDASVNEDHVLFLLSKYRGALLQQYHNIKKAIPESNYQIICLTLKPSDKLPCLNGPGLMSVEEIPDLSTIGTPSVLLVNGMESENIVFVPFVRLKAVGYNKWKKNFIYAAVGPDNHLYLSFCNPQAKYLSEIKLRGIFEDFEKATELACKDDKICDVMQMEFPLEVSLVPDLIARVVRDILGIAYRVSDQTNNSKDDLGDLEAFIRKTMKSQFVKPLEGQEE